MAKNKLSAADRNELLSTLKTRFEKNMNRHKGIKWTDVEAKLNKNVKALNVLNEMEYTGGEPDVVGFDKKTGEYIFYDCAAESPKGRRSLCYDRKAWEKRKENKPEGNAIDAAADIGIEILNEEEYLALQNMGEFDTKTSSWLRTPDEIRKLGGAIMGDRRYNRSFIGHNGADSYYAARGFRGSLRV